MIAIRIAADPALFDMPARFLAFKEGIAARLPTMLDQIGKDIVGRSRENYLSGPRPGKLGHGSGDLARSVESEVRGDSVVVGSNLPYAAIHEYGGRTAPHIIRPKNASVLSWIGGATTSFAPVKRGNKTFTGKMTSGGQRVFAQEVHHPGSKIPARPYLRPALEDARNDEGPNGIRGIVLQHVEAARQEAFRNG